MAIQKEACPIYDNLSKLKLSPSLIYNIALKYATLKPKLLLEELSKWGFDEEKRIYLKNLADHAIQSSS